MKPQEPALGLQELTSLVRDCSVSGVERRVLLLRTDLLPGFLSRPHHLRLAHEALEPLVGADRARRHELSHNRVAISWRGQAAERLTMALDRLDHLLLDAPLDAPAMPELARLFELPKDGTALIAVAASPLQTTPSKAESPADGTPAGPAKARPAEPGPTQLPPLDLQTLETVESRLATANVARFARRRTVCRVGATSFAAAWETRFLSIQELMTELCPGRNAYTEPWLFRRLTRMLDRRMLALLSSASELRDAGPFSLNLNVSGILSPEFLRFDGALPNRLRGNTVLDLQPADVMGDIPSFRFATAFARARGYRFMLRAITPPLIKLLDLAALEVEFLELRWSPALAGLEPAALKAGDARWVLTRVDQPAALRWGQSSGIGLFQGDMVNPGNALDPGQRPRRAAA